jgi:diguanylate cyclase (GGDEF)-like protein/PAS domain S-box-containing protein
VSNGFETVSLRKEVLSRLGVSYMDLKTGEGFADSHWLDLGHTFDDMTGEPWLERIHPADREHVRQVLSRHLRGETPEFKCEFRVRTRDGSYRWFISSGIVERRDRNGTPVSYVGHNEDVTNLHRLREELQEARRVAEERASEAEALRGAGAVVVASLDAPTAVRSVIQQLTTLVPIDSALVCELESRQLRLVGGSSDMTEQTWRLFARKRLRQFLKVIKSRIPELAAGTDEGASHTLFVPLVVRGSTVGVLTISRKSGGFAGEEVRIAMSMADYLALALSNARLYSRMQQRAEIDPLSGVLTRRAFTETSEQAMDQAFHGKKPLCCMILDLDHFKSINDTYGHPVGDQVIRTLGAVMRDSLRSTDVLGRFGGEEFCALLTDTDIKQGMEAAERLRAAIEATDFAGTREPVTASIGLAGLGSRDASARNHDSERGRLPDGEWPERLSIEQIIQRADVALYNAKSGGRNRVVVYEHGMTDHD